MTHIFKVLEGFFELFSCTFSKFDLSHVSTDLVECSASVLSAQIRGILFKEIAELEVLQTDSVYVCITN